MLALLINVSMESVNISLVVMTTMCVPLKVVLTANARALQRAVMIVMHVPLILVTRQLDAKTLLSLVTTTILAPPILAILTLDAFTLQLTAMTKILALLILASTETVSINKKLVMIPTNAPLKPAILPLEIVCTPL
jgi:hypothetical protein